jgi:hypothetical protein
MVPIFLFTAVAVFISFGVHMVSHGASAFPGGYILDGRYLVEEHGKVIELTRGQFWTGYILGCAMVTTGLLYFGAVAYFYRTGELSGPKRD